MPDDSPVIRPFEDADEPAVVAPWFHATLGYTDDNVVSQSKRLEHSDH